MKAGGRADHQAVHGGIAQLEEHLLCKQGVSGSNPLTSTKQFAVGGSLFAGKSAGWVVPIIKGLQRAFDYRYNREFFGSR